HQEFAGTQSTHSLTCAALTYTELREKRDECRRGDVLLPKKPVVAEHRNQEMLWLCAVVGARQNDGFTGCGVDIAHRAAFFALRTLHGRIHISEPDRRVAVTAVAARSRRACDHGRSMTQRSAQSPTAMLRSVCP